MKLQLIDGHLARPMGLLEQVVLSTCEIEFVYPLAIVDFGLKSTHDIILGRPFMMQLKMIQDWGSNHIYLKGKHGATKIDKGDHTYRDVAKIPLVDYDSHTFKNSKLPAWQQAKAQFWMCGASKNGSLQEEKNEREMSETCYIP